MATSFFFYTSYAEWGKAGLTESQYSMYLAAILYYGTTGTYATSDPTVEALFAQVRYSIDATKQRYEKAQKNGGKGGRPSISGPKMRLYAAQMSNPRLQFDVTQEFLMEDFKCSKRTVQRKCPTEYLEKLEKMRRDREDQIMIYNQGRARYKAMGVTLYDFVGPSLPNLYQILYLDTLERDLCIGLDDVKELTKGRPYTQLRIESCTEGERWADRIERKILRTGKTPYGDTVEVVWDPDGGRRLKVVARAEDKTDTSEINEYDFATSALAEDENRKHAAVESCRRQEDAGQERKQRLFAFYYARGRRIVLYDSFQDAAMAAMDASPDERKIADSLEEIHTWIGSLPVPKDGSTEPFQIIKGRKMEKFQHTWIPQWAFVEKYL